jgi:molybdate transport system substrate-binding protein
MKTHLLLVAMLAFASSAEAAELRVITSGAMRDVTQKMADEFGAANGHNIEIVSRPVAGVVEMVEAGEPADIVMASDAAMSDLSAAGHVTNALTLIGHIGIGAVVREGAEVPSIATREEFREAMLAAGSIAYMNPETGVSSGIALQSIFAELSLTDEIAGKSVIFDEGLAAEHIARGEAEIGLQNMTQLIGVEGVTLVGPLPAEIQVQTSYYAGVSANSAEPAAAAALIAYLTRAEAQALWREAGFSVAQDARQDAPPVADFAGYWARPEPGVDAALFYPAGEGPVPVTFGAEAGESRRGRPMIGDDTNPILLPHAADSVRAQRDQYRRGEAVWSAWALCWPAGVPLAFAMIDAVQFLQTEDEVTILSQRGQTVRHVYLNEAHLDDPTVSWFGHSVGHYEGANTLVVDTIAQDSRAYLDRFATPKSEAMRLVERYTISPDRQRLEIAFDIEDPLTFTTAWSAKVTYIRLPPHSGDATQEPVFAEIICPENNRDPQGGSFAIPIATKFDF